MNLIKSWVYSILMEIEFYFNQRKAEKKIQKVGFTLLGAVHKLHMQFQSYLNVVKEVSNKQIDTYLINEKFKKSWGKIDSFCLGSKTEIGC